VFTTGIAAQGFARSNPRWDLRLGVNLGMPIRRAT
jgi:hypothetical protein